MFTSATFYNSIIAVVLIIYQCVDSAPVSFTDCANGELKSIRIEPCPFQPCHFDKGALANLTITFVPTRPAKRLTVYSSLRTGGLFDYELVLTPLDNQVCKANDSVTDQSKLDCPLQLNKEYTFVFSREFPISTSFNIFRYSKLKLVDENGQNVVCGDLRLEFQRIYSMWRTEALTTAAAAETL